jgi:N-acetylneuraminic acid mutarotase
VTGVIGQKLYVLTCVLEEDCYLDVTPLSLYRYDPGTDQWTFLSSSPALRGRPMTGFIGGKFYVTGDTGPNGEVATFHA